MGWAPLRDWAQEGSEPGVWGFLPAPGHCWPHCANFGCRWAAKNGQLNFSSDPSVLGPHPSLSLLSTCKLPRANYFPGFRAYAITEQAPWVPCSPEPPPQLHIQRDS